MLTARIAYFSMEIGLESAMPTYAGGLGGLAGDTLRAAADAAAPMVGVTLLHRNGYFWQSFDPHGNQRESPWVWEPEKFLKLMPHRVSVELEGRRVFLQPWRYDVQGISGHTVPVYFLDSDLDENDLDARDLTTHLYGGDDRYRLKQEALLGIGGVTMLRALGYRAIDTFHMNEGHAGLLSVALLDEMRRGDFGSEISPRHAEAIKAKCVFTTHTPVSAGHDQFDWGLVASVLGPMNTKSLQGLRLIPADKLNMTSLAIRFSRYVNAVSMKHGEVSREMFPDVEVHHITNGVHAGTWASPYFDKPFDRYMNGWRRDNRILSNADEMPLDELSEAHSAAKQKFLDSVAAETGKALRPDIFTIGFARRATPYKRADLLFSDIERLRRIARSSGGLQIIYAGKAHPRDFGGKEIIKRVFDASQALDGDVQVVYLTNHSMDLTREMCAGVDIWLNTPEKPREASGTSGMKAALNGVPSLSTLDGWWVEGHVEGVTGWSIGNSAPENNPVSEAEDLYQKLEHVILPMYYDSSDKYRQVMRAAIAMNGARFTAQNMLEQYVDEAYRVHGQDKAASGF